MRDAAPSQIAADRRDAAQELPAQEWIKPEVTKLDLETAQQTGIPI